MDDASDESLSTSSSEFTPLKRAEKGASDCTTSLTTSIAVGDSISDGSIVGEQHELLKSYEEDSLYFANNVQIELDHNVVADLKRGTSFYGHPLSAEKAGTEMPPGGGGLVWHATIVPNDFVSEDGKLRRGLIRKDYDIATRTIKPRRPTLPATAKDFFASLTQIEGPRWIFHGVLNGWPALTCLELVALERRRGGLGSFVSPKEIMIGKLLWTDHWRADRQGLRGVPPQVDHGDGIYRAVLRGAPWTSSGWSRESPGFLFWFEAQHPEGPRLSYGTNAVKMVGEAKCTQVHMVSHRYVVARESPKDKLTYHSIVLLEWDHGQYCTVVELAFLNGMGGYKCKSNWYDDHNEAVTQLFLSFPPEMIAPWLTSSAEIRCYDVKARTLDEFKRYVEKYEGSRFIDPRFTFSHRARLTYRTKSNIAQYLLNYVCRDSSYSEMKKNCQTFVADLCSFLAGKKGIEPFHPVCRIDYRNQTHRFLYESHMYERIKRAISKKEKK